MNEQVDEQGCRTLMLPAQHSTDAGNKTDGADKDVNYMKADLVCPQSGSKSVGQRIVASVAFID